MPDAKRGLLIVLSGPSGVGKDTVLRQLLDKRGDCVLSVSATTRPPRANETDGVDYYFISRERFRALVAEGKMLEYAEFAGNLYGTPAEAVERHRENGRHVILEIDVQGAMQIKKKSADAVFVFLMPPSLAQLRERLECRGTETPESIGRRLTAAEREMTQAAAYDYMIVNHTVEQSCALLDAIITASTCSVRLLRHLQEGEERNA